ncbi:enoyl-CoA hydratase-related protein [Streptomyces sp. NPDC026672]|uniref:enoyl-CoA hydratase-related protein n=1 Tax=unclassified Streptomyces TaxID=2593676 RepID=UPI0033CBFA9F
MTDSTPPPSPAVTWSTDGPVFVATMANPPANQLGRALVDGLMAALDAFEASDARVLVVASALDGLFAAGADIKLMSSVDRAGFAAYGAQLRTALDRLAGLARPSIAAVDGRALGGGLELALACTMRVGSASARLGLPEPRLGLIPGAGGTQRLPRLVGRGRALDMMLTAREVEAPEALAFGLLDRVGDGPALDTALDLARRLAELSGPALGAILRCVDDAAELPFAQGAANEASRVEDLFDSPEGREGLAAFLAKRPANFAR